MVLCAQCSSIPFGTLFGTSRRPRQYSIGSLGHISINSARCAFCCFLVEALELGVGAPLGQLTATSKELSLGFQISARFYSDSKDDEEPWIEQDGVAVKARTGPTLWLQMSGVPIDSACLRDYIVCISCKPAEMNPEDTSSIVPRRRDPIEVFGCRLRYDLIKTWLHICDTKHSERCSRSTDFKRQMLQLRLIDVDHRRIQWNNDYEPYMALSYVWGPLHRDDYEDFWNDKGPDADDIDLPARLPQSLEDAITFTGKMGCRYLWIDAFCINQNDGRERREQIANMHLIYECASLTIAAMNGRNARAGLSGVSVALQRLQQPIVKVPYGEFMATYVHNAWLAQGTSPWETRAWTLQELLLSRRVIFLNQYYPTMRCSCEFFTSLLAVANRSDRPHQKQCDNYYWINGFDTDLHKRQWSFLVFDNLLANYTRRALSNEDDALSACLGALNEISRNTGVSFMQGLPRADLHLGLLWKPHHHDCVIRREDFPSWSWLGWRGRIEHHYCIDEMPGHRWQGVGLAQKQAEQRQKPLSPEENAVIAAQEAFIVEQGESTLRISSQIARASVRQVRKQGEGMTGLSPNSEQATEAMGDHWVLLSDMREPVMNEVGEVAKFEPIDYSFQVHPMISERLDQSDGRCELLFIKYFPFLRGHGIGENYTWIFDYVGCLVLLQRDDSPSNSNVKYERIGFVFLRLEDWVQFKLENQVVDLV